MMTRPAGALALLLVLSLVAGAVEAAGDAGVVVSGVVRSDEKVEIKSKQTVAIARIAVVEGAFARQGDVLIEMSNGIQRAQLEAAKAEVARAEASVAEAELAVTTTTREYERNRSIADLITEKELTMSRDGMERAKASLATKRQDLLRARADVMVAEANLADTIITAPFDGVVTRIYLRIGATPKGTDQTLLDFQSLERLYVEVAVPLTFLPSMKPGRAVAVTVEDEHKTIASAVRGTVRYVYPEIDTALRMFRMKVDVPAQQMKVLPGMMAKVTIRSADSPR